MGCPAHTYTHIRACSQTSVFGVRERGRDTEDVKLAVSGRARACVRCVRGGGGDDAGIVPHIWAGPGPGAATPPNASESAQLGNGARAGVGSAPGRSRYSGRLWRRRRLAAAPSPANG